MRSLSRWLLRSSLLLLALALGACDTVDDIAQRLRGATPREDYELALRDAGLLETALGRDWIAAAESALRQPLPSDVPVEETGYLDPAEPRAVALLIRLDRGQRVAINASLVPAGDAQLFLDVLRVDSAESSNARHIAAADSGTRALEFEPSRSASYIVRLQPELLRGGRYTLTVRTRPALSFPVEGIDGNAIGSRFGAPRDGGARDHHGVDIFAPRGTPALAAARGVISGVRETPIGGKVVWLRDERRSLSLYYAHLDSQLVSNGARVDIGDTLGLVGNTGNARTTPPHLHFGIYRRGEGPLDPFPFVREWQQTVPALRADTALLGDWARTTTRLSLRGVSIDPNTPVRVRGAAGDRYRAELPDGTLLWIAAHSLERMNDAMAVMPSSPGCNLRDRPTPNSAVITELAPSERVAVLGRFDHYRLVRADSVRGWTDCG